MDLPIEGHTLRHYTRSRPRPNRRNSKPPSKPQEQAAESEENEANETMGRVDEGVEEFFTKKIIPDDPVKAQREEVPYKAQPTESTSTTPAPPSTSAPVPPSSSTTSITSSSSSSMTVTTTNPTTTTTTPSTAPSKNIKKKFGDFFAFKKVRAGRGAKGEGGPEGKVKKTSIADLIRPLREAKEREREKEREKGKLEEESGAKATSVNDSDATTTVRAAEDNTMAPAAPSDVPSVPTSLPTSAPAQEEVTSVSPSALTPSPIISPFGGFLAEREKSRTLEKSKTPDGERRLKATRRSLREGKSQSLILLTGLEDGAAAHGKKHTSECTSSFEQRLHVMLHRMGVAKTPPADTKTSQNKEEELRKTNSEGAILDKKPEPPPTFVKPRTMSTSASDTRRPIRAGLTSLEAIRTDKPLFPGRPIGPLPPKPTVAAKPPLPAPQQHPASTRTSPGVPWEPNTATAPETQTQTQPTEPVPSQSQTQPQQSEPPSPNSHKETPPAPSPHRGPSSLESRERAVRAQSVTEESLPKPQSRMKPSPQRRAVSVYEDSLREHAALLDPEELKAALPRLQRSPVQKHTNLRELPTCSENQQEGEEAGEAGQKKERTGESEGMDSRPATEDKPEPGSSPAGANQVEGESTAEKRGETVSRQHTAQAETSDQRTEPPLMEKHMD